MTKEKLEEYKKKAHAEGFNDSLIDEVLTDHALAFIDSEVTDELTDEEHTEIVKAYCSGFMGDDDEYTQEQKKQIMEQELKYEQGFRFLHCAHCLDEYMAEREKNGGESDQSPRDAMNYEMSSVPFTYPNGTTASVLALWCKKCGRPVWDSRHLTHLF